MQNFYGYFIDLVLDKQTILHIIEYFIDIIPIKFREIEENSEGKTGLEIIQQIYEINRDINHYDTLSIIPVIIVKKHPKKYRIEEIRFILGYSIEYHNRLSDIKKINEIFGNKIKQLKTIRTQNGKPNKFRYSKQIKIELTTVKKYSQFYEYIDYEKIYCGEFEGILEENVIYIIDWGEDEQGVEFADICRENMETTEEQITDYDMDDRSKKIFGDLGGIRFRGVIRTHARYPNDVSEQPEFELTENMEYYLKEYIGKWNVKLLCYDEYNGKYMEIRKPKIFEKIMVKSMKKRYETDFMADEIDFNDWYDPSIITSSNCNRYLDLSIVLKTKINDEEKIICSSLSEGDGISLIEEDKN
jgi:hypothetical protein